MSDTSLRARRATEIVDAAFALYRRHPMPFLMVSAIANVPSLLITILSGQLGSESPQFTSSAAWGTLVGLFTGMLANAVINRAGSSLYLDGTLDIADAVRRTLPRLPVLVATFVVQLIAIAVGFLLLIVPGVYLMLRWFPSTQAIVLEDKGVFGSMARAGQLTEGRKGHVFATVALVFGIYMLLSLGIGWLAGMAGQPVLLTAVETVLSILLAPIMGLTGLVLYYDLRIRHEGFDLEYMTQSLGTAPADGSAPADGTAPAVS